MRQLYFHHISKTAGTTLTSLIEMHIPRERICPANTIDELWGIDRRDLDQYLFFRGPFANALEPLLSVPPIRVVVLRDPIERALSHFLMGTRMTPGDEHPHTLLARELPLGEAIRHEYFAHLFNNYMARYLAFDFDHAVLSWTPFVTTFHPSIQQVRADSFPLETDGLRERALKALLAYDVVGISGCVYDCYEQVCTLMGWEGRVTARFRNTGDPSVALRMLQNLSADDFAFLVSTNQIDLFLYQIAKQLVRCETVPTLEP